MKLLLLLPFRLWLWLSPCSSPVADNHVFGHLDLIKEIRIKENKKKTVYLGQKCLQIYKMKKASVYIFTSTPFNQYKILIYLHDMNLVGVSLSGYDLGLVVVIRYILVVVVVILPIVRVV